MWIKNLRGDLVDDLTPKTYELKLILWMWVALVFKDDEIFRKTTFTAIRTRPSGTKVDGLPIPSHIFCKSVNVDLCGCADEFSTKLTSGENLS